LLNSSAADSFELVNYYYPIPARATKGATPVCTGIVLKDIPAPVGCGRLVFAVPRYAGHTVQEGPYASLSSYMSQFNLSDLSDKHERKRFEGARERIRTLTASLVKNCGLPQLAYSTDPKPTPAKELENDISEAHKRAAMADDLARIERAANLILREKDLQPASATEQSRVLGLRAARARFLLRSFEDEAYRGCRADQRQAYRDSLHLLFLPSNFEEILSERGLIAVFEVGPREQVQQVSSVSRVANNLSMALSLAASAPSAGVGASAAANYSREAIGRAATLERVPALIGYAAADDIFGWVVTPKAMFDPKGSVRLEQSPRTLDLTADLSVPSWWPRFAIEITTGWAAGAQPITHGNIALPVHRTATVQMAANYADFDELTARIQHGAATREVVLDEVVLKGQFVAKCRPTNLYLRGPNIWRTTAVVLGGYQLDESAITVAPDMSGILLAVPALDEHIVGPSRADLPLTVFTRHGHKEGFVEYRAVQDGCKPPEKPDDPNKPVITSVVPTAFKAGTLVFFTITSSNLEKFKKVTLNGAPGTLLESIDGGKSIRARFEVANTNIAASRAVQLVFYDDKKEIGEWKVESTK
jgi:hypothetical protein